MKIAVLGTGKVGGTLGRRWSQLGHQVTFGTRDAQQPRVAALVAECGAQAAPLPQAVADADVVVLALPWTGVLSTCEQLAPALAGKTVVDCINPLNSTFSGLDLGFTTSAAEEIARRLPAAKVVKAFNMVSAATMANPLYDGQPATLFYCGDDGPAKQVIAELATQLGFAAVDSGPLTNARLLEPLAMLYIHLAFHGWGANCAFQVVKR